MISNNLSGSWAAANDMILLNLELRLAFLVSGALSKIGEFLGEWRWWHWHENEVILEVAVPICQRFGYLPIPNFEVTSSQFQELANNQFNWIFYYVGHGEDGPDRPNSTNPKFPPIETVNPHEDGVLAEDINANSKLVFLNSCFSAALYNNEIGIKFADAFHIDGKYKNADRPEAYIGWTGYVGNDFSNLFALEFWIQLGQGKTVAGAIAEAQSKMSQNDPKGYLEGLYYKEGAANGTSSLDPLE